ncbi:hypothetical protein, partial [Klebsiella pneumoniae]|uniref:hypothetical protein n=1 Tax=Klebsiella pneumoniae TaxID=573 RepID=UPI00224374CA
KACVLPENPASYRVVRTKSYLFNKAPGHTRCLPLFTPDYSREIYSPVLNIHPMYRSSPRAFFRHDSRKFPSRLVLTFPR